MSHFGVLPPKLVLDRLLHDWLLEDIGRGDRTTQSLLAKEVRTGLGSWVAKTTRVACLSGLKTLSHPHPEL